MLGVASTALFLVVGLQAQVPEADSHIDVRAQQRRSPLPAPVPTGRKAIGVVLEGGGALGLAHIGVLQWFEDNHIPVDRMAGTSMGALIGGLYASGQKPHDIERLAESDLFGDIFSIEAPYDHIGYRRRQDRRELPQAITLGLKNGVSFRNAILSDSELYALLRAQLSSNNQADGDFNRLPVPFRCVATDLNTFQPVIFSHGSMADAIRASISIPGVFAPIQYRGHYLVDGAMVNNLPTDVARKELQSGIVIAVHLKVGPFQESDVDSVLSVFSRALSAGISKTEQQGIARADVVVTVDTQKYTTTDYARARGLIQLGYQAAENQRARLIQLRLSDDEWNQYVVDRNSRRVPKPTFLTAVRVDGASGAARREALASMESLKGKTIEAASITNALRRVEGSGTRDVSFETFQAGPPSSPDSTASSSPDNGVVIHLGEARNGPPYLLLGADITASTSNVTRNSVDFRYVHQDLGGYGAELRGDIRVGFQTQGSLEYYRPLFRGGLFLQPHLGIVREPVYIWRDQKRIAEQFHQVAGGGIDLGRSFNRRTQLAAEYRADATRWHLTSGLQTSPTFSGSSQTAVLHFSYDSAVAGAVSPKGLRFDATAGSRFSTIASDNAPLAQFSLSKTSVFRQKNVIGLRAEANSYFRHQIADPFRFTLGGPLRLSASSIDEYRGTDTYLLRAGYLRRIAALPSGLGQGVYLTGAYEAGEIWSPERAAILRQNFVSGIVASTPLGVITVAGSIGDAGRRKVFFTLGRFF